MRWKGEELVEKTNRELSAGGPAGCDAASSNVDGADAAVVAGHEQPVHARRPLDAVQLCRARSRVEAQDRSAAVCTHVVERQTRALGDRQRARGQERGARGPGQRPEAAGARPTLHVKDLDAVLELLRACQRRAVRREGRGARARLGTGAVAALCARERRGGGEGAPGAVLAEAREHRGAPHVRRREHALLGRGGRGRCHSNVHDLGRVPLQRRHRGLGAQRPHQARVALLGELGGRVRHQRAARNLAQPHIAPSGHGRAQSAQRRHPPAAGVRPARARRDPRDAIQPKVPFLHPLFTIAHSFSSKKKKQSYKKHASSCCVHCHSSKMNTSTCEDVCKRTLTHANQVECL